MLVLVEYYLSKAGIVLRDEEGQGLIEYVLIASLIAIVAIVAMQLVGTNVTARFNEVAGELT